ncbi:indole-3-glycerol phosphate synthase TrpC [Eisenibacter elegans]|jgi:indole-3-glycerol phosphate synthase|uniref:indole-3-glycerol phosphate synthase TrpC n=1 Tax=Eisenibacter elegans TaxID=997 RepID=UPI00047CBEDD|nr:indole-3-glycerol phosphate synthase TrpC [Eisenibacter elegans]
MNILDQIIAYKREEVLRNREKIDTKTLESFLWFDRPTLSLAQALRKPEASGIIAEFKRQSPSKGVINGQANATLTTQGYQEAGASGISVLTDTPSFGGSDEDLMLSRKQVGIPMLRKDFIVDEYQLVEAKAIGADVILLIAACLSPTEVRRLAQFAKSLHLEVLLELHSAEELAHICPEVDLVGVNNRDLRSFMVSIEHSLSLAAHIPPEFVKVSESGLSKPETILSLKEAGFQGFLIGETFMRQERPAEACASLIGQLKQGVS